jgi:transcriptional regulator with XRE-family HTH domain
MVRVMTSGRGAAKSATDASGWGLIVQTSCTKIARMKHIPSEAVALRNRRVNALLTRERLGQAVGASKWTVGAWERGDRSIPREAIEPLSKALGCSASEVTEPPDGSRPDASLHPQGGRRANDPGQEFSSVSLRTWRALRGLTQLALSESAKVCVTTICEWERGRRVPSADQLERVAHALGCTLDDLARDPVLICPDPE